MCNPRRSTSSWFAVWVIALTLSGTMSHAAGDDLEALYLANEGVLIAQGDTKIIFDPLYDNTYNTYQAVPDVLRSALLAAQPPFDNIQALFVSHSHGDHFSAQDVAAFLRAHPQAVVVAPSQAIETLRQAQPATSSERLIAIELDYDAEPITLSVGSLTVEAVRIAHAGGPERRAIQNILYRVTLPEDGVVIHMGDADPAPANYQPYADHWRAKRTDVAFPPYWFFREATTQTYLSQGLNAKRSVGVHVPVDVPAELRASGADFFSQPGESRTISVQD